MSESPFFAFAERHDLDYAERVLPGRGQPLPGGEVSEVAGGRLPGGLDGFVARLARRENPDRRDEVTEYGLLVTRVPESLSFLFYLSCRDTEFRGITDRLIGPGGLIPLVDHTEFESIELNRRYRIGTFRGLGENRLRQLFAPTFIDWMASSAPDGLYFELFGGMLLVTLAGQMNERADVEHLCELSTHVAERLRTEALEGEAAGPSFALSAPPALAEAERKGEERLAKAGFETPPTDVESALERLEPVVRESSGGLLRRVFRSINRDEATILALEAVMRGYAARHGLERQGPQQFMSRHMGLRFPIVPQVSLHGVLPGTGLTGDLFAMRLGAGGELAFGPGGVLEAGDGGGALVQVLPKGKERGNADTVMMGGWTLRVGDGQRRQSEASRHDSEAARSIAGTVGDDYGVTVYRGDAATIPNGAVQWLLADGKAGERALMRDGGTLTLISSNIPAREWSVATLDDFCASIAPLAADFAARA